MKLLLVLAMVLVVVTSLSVEGVGNGLACYECITDSDCPPLSFCVNVMPISPCKNCITINFPPKVQ